MTLVVFIFISMSRIFIPENGATEDGMENRISMAYRGEDKDSLDVIFVGNSDIYRGLSPVDLYYESGITSAVAGKPNNDLQNIKGDIKDILRYQKPKVIVLETDCMFESRNFTFSKKSSASEKSTPMSTFKGIKSMIKNGDSAIISGINFHFPLIKYHDNWSKLTLKSILGSHRNFYKFSNKGMAFSNKVDPYSASPSYMTDYANKKENLTSENEAAFKAICDICSENGIRLVLMTVPSANTWNDAKSDIVQRKAAENGLTYYDYNRSYPEGFDWGTCSKDGGNHLNYTGALTVTKDFAGRLVNEMGMAPSDLTKEQVQQWREDYRFFHEKVAGE